MLEDLAYFYTQQSELAFTLTGYVAIALGAVLSAIALPVREDRLSRSYFYLRLGMASFVLMINQMWWLLYVPALTAGVSWLLMASDGLAYLAYGAYLIRIAQARSRDGYGDTSRAWFILIPIANLFLLFKPSVEPLDQNRSAAAAWIGVVCFALSRLGMSALMGAVEARTVADMQADPRAVAAFQTLLLRHEGPEAGLDSIVTAEAAPRRLGPDLTLAAVSRQALQVRYDFVIDMVDATSLDPDYLRQFTANVCATYLPYMALGASVTLHYTRSDGATVETLDLTLASCTT